MPEPLFPSLNDRVVVVAITTTALTGHVGEIIEVMANKHFARVLLDDPVVWPNPLWFAVDEIDRAANSRSRPEQP